MGLLGNFMRRADGVAGFYAALLAQKEVDKIFRAVIILCSAATNQIKVRN